MVDYGDAAVLPADPARSHAAIEATVGDVVAAGPIPIVLGGDHSIAEPDIRACAAAHGPVGLVHFDAHTDTAAECFGVSLSHGTPMYNLVQSGHVDPGRYVQIGLRGYWPGEDVFAWQREQGITSLFMHDVTERGIRAVVGETIAAAGPGPVFVTIDVDVLDPAFAPGTGTPEPGGMTLGRSAVGRPRAGGRARRGRRRRGGGVPDGDRGSGYHRPGGLADRARAAHRDRAATRGGRPGEGSGSGAGARDGGVSGTSGVSTANRTQGAPDAHLHHAHHADPGRGPDDQEQPRPDQARSTARSSSSGPP